MDDMPTAVSTAGFNLDAWREKLLACNSWARGLVIDEKEAAFTDARRQETRKRHAEGMEKWNDWADEMLALRSALETARQWKAQREVGAGKDLRAWEALAGENKWTREWLALARAAFSTGKSRDGTRKAAPHHFEGDISFTGYTFPSDAEFEGARFSGNARFGNARFFDIANFTNATFSRAWFGHAEFCGYARFGGATFCDDAWFDRATFSRDAWFRNATFEKDSDFNKAVFDCAVDTDKALRPKEHSVVDFAQAKFKGGATLKESRFAQSVSFEGIDSSGTFSLAGAAFRRVPSLIGATFKGALRLDIVETPLSRWTLGYTPDKDATAHFRELRRHAVEAQDRNSELEFFAQEIRTGRFHADWLPPWVPKVWSWRFWLGLAYGALSDFGRSLWRPLLAWLVLTLGFGAFYMGEHQDMQKARAALAPSGVLSTAAAYVTTTRDAWTSPPACRTEAAEQLAPTDPFTEAFILSLRNGTVFSRVDSARRTHACLFGGEAMISPRVWLAGNAQSLASAILIFLFLLAVRNLLRLK